MINRNARYCLMILLLVLILALGGCGKPDPDQQTLEIETTYIKLVEREVDTVNKCITAKELNEAYCWGQSQMVFRDYTRNFYDALKAMSRTLPNGLEHSLNCYEQCVTNAGVGGQTMYNPVFFQAEEQLRAFKPRGLPGCFENCRRYFLAANGIEI